MQGSMKSAQDTWRLVDTGPLDGAANMAVDEALLAGFVPQESLPVFRLYGWHPPALSLGRYQQAAEVLDLPSCARHGIQVVRRITGGGVIYHAEELTYSIVCAPRHIPQARAVKESFERLCGFILLTYRKLGLDASFAVEHTHPDVKLGGRADFCFAGKEEYDIVVSGRKIGGNAQRRRKEVIFQHGSIPLQPCVSAALRFLRQTPAGLERSTASLAELGVAVSAEHLKELVAASFRECFNVLLSPDTLTGREQRSAEALRTGKYCRDSWNVSGEPG